MNIVKELNQTTKKKNDLYRRENLLVPVHDKGT